MREAQLEAGLADVVQEIERLKAQRNITTRARTRLGAENDDFRKQLNTIRDENKMYQERNTELERLNEGVRGRLEQTIEERDGLATQFKEKEMKIQLLEAQATQTRVPANTSHEPSSTDSTMMREAKKSVEEYPEQDDNLSQANEKLVGFQVLLCKGDDYFYEITDERSLPLDGAEMLRKSLAISLPSNHRPKELRPHVWKLQTISLEEEKLCADLTLSSDIGQANIDAPTATTGGPPVPQTEMDQEVLQTKISCKLPTQQAHPSRTTSRPAPESLAPAPKSADASNNQSTAEFAEREPGYDHLRDPRTTQTPSLRPPKRPRADYTTDEEFRCQNGRRQRPTCVRCHSSVIYCDGGAQCRACWHAGERCAYKICSYGSGCRHVYCMYLHPDQYDAGDRRWKVEGGGKPPRRSLKMDSYRPR